MDRHSSGVICCFYYCNARHATGQRELHLIINVYQSDAANLALRLRRDGLIESCIIDRSLAVLGCSRQVNE